jgi:hypothetical protein
MANGVRSMNARLAACSMGSGEKPLSLEGSWPFSAALLTSTLSVVDDDVDALATVLVVSVEMLEIEILDLDAECRIEGVRSDSRAFGSSSFVYRPIEGRCTTCGYESR